jgi:RNA polymerase sigma factor (sigma-70 family)
MPSTHREAIEAVWRIESPRLIAGLTRLTRDVGLAEELAQDAFVAALEQWPGAGIPDNPGAWLTTTARRRAVDRIRRDRAFARAHEAVARENEWDVDPSREVDASLDDSVGDDLLRLIFMTCHPVLGPEARAAITLRLLCGLTTDEVARAFLSPEPTIAQRIVRAKKTLAEKKVPFEVPGPEALKARLASVLEVIYLLFNEGYSATAGDDWHRPALCDEALRLGRVLAGLMPRESEVYGLVSLMEIQASRSRARTSPDGRPILLLEQNRALWDQLLIRRGLTALAHAIELANQPGPYMLQAAIAACHARAATSEATYWRQIVRLYELLGQVSPSPVVELNRAVAVSMADGPGAALQIVDRLAEVGDLNHYHLLPSVRADLLRRLSRFGEARVEYLRAAQLTRNARERVLLTERAEECARQAP